MSPRPTGIVADVALRLIPPPARRSRARLAVATVLALLLEGAVFYAIWRERNYVPTPQPEEIPVEIVTEPPPPPPPPPPPSPSASPEPTPTPEPTPSPEQRSQEYEKPATDAPREGKSDHDDDHVGEKEKPAAPPASPEPSPTPSQSAAASPSPEPTPTPSQPAEASPEPSPTASTPETAAPELPKSEQGEAPQPEKTEAPKPPAVATSVAGLPKSFADVPDVDFGGAAIKSEVTGGDAKATYFSKLYGLIIPRVHVPPLARAYGRTLHGVLVFEIDGRGRLVQRGIRQGSGSLELDEAVMEAVAAASRSFPAPPRHAPMVIDFNYSSGN